MSKTINVYDFDHTIYDGDASIDFYLFCLQRRPALLRYLPLQLWHATLYVLRLESRTIFKGHYFMFLRGLNDPTSYVDRFWATHYRNIRPWYQSIDHSRDVIISASPSFLLAPAVRKMKALALIATELDTKTGKLVGENCRGTEKARRLRETFPKEVINKAYSDSLSDLPILSLATEAYIVKGNQITNYEAKG